MALQIGRKGRLYVVQETGSGGGNSAGYGQIQDGSSSSNTLSAAARGIRHLDFKAMFDPLDRENSKEKKASPGTVYQFDRRTTASLTALDCVVRPSGTINTLPEANPIYLAGFGSKTNVSLSTTIAVGGAGTTTADTLTSAAGLAVGDALLITGADGRKYIRFITAVNTGTGVTTWAPALPAPVTDGNAVKACLTYKLTTDLAISLAFLHCLDAFRRELRGVGIDKLSFELDANMEPQFKASGPAQTQYSDSAAVADPSSFTAVGGNPPSGIVGDTYIADTLYLMRKATVEIKNGLKVRNSEYGYNSDSGIASDVYRDGRRDISISMDCYVETAATLFDFAKAGTNKSFFNQTGRTEGNCIALYCPKVYWRVPDTTAPDGPATWTFKGIALESADAMNDECYFAMG